MKGSTWNKWNFHVHTKETNKNDLFVSKDFNSFCLYFFKKAIEKNISAIGITDYFSIDNYVKVKVFVSQIENFKDNNQQNYFDVEECKFIKGIFIFPNIELRMLPATGVDKLINIHCLFNPDYVSSLENDFFGTIENQENFKMNRKGITDYGKHLNPSISDEKKLYKEGINNFVIDPKTLKNLLEKNKKFRENTIVVVSNSNKDGNSGYQKHYDLFENEKGSLDGVRKTIYQISDAIFSNNQKDIKYFLGKSKENDLNITEQEREAEKEKVVFERGSLKPCIVGCDAHKEDDLFSRFTWIKGNLDFEGLKQIIYEPEQRVKIQVDKPDTKDSKLVIDSVKFISPDKTFTSNVIHFNPNLNVIIGGKSSGKSILLFCIAKTLLSDKQILRIDDKKPLKYKYEFNNDFDFEVKVLTGLRQSIKDEDSVLPQIKYIPQNYLSKLAEPESKKGNELNKLVRELLLEEPDYKEKYKDFLDNVVKKDAIREDFINHFFDLKNKIKNLESEIRQKGNPEALKISIEQKESSVTQLKEQLGLTPQQIENYNKLNKESSDLENTRQKLNSDYSKITNFNNELKNVLEKLINQKQLLIDSLQSKEIKDFYSIEYDDIDLLLAKVSTISNSLKLNEQKAFIEDNLFKKHQIELNEQKATLNNKLEPFLRDQDTKKQIQEIEKNILDDRQKLQQYELLLTDLSKTKESLITAKERIFNLLKETYQEYVEVIKNLENRVAGLNDNKFKIQGKVKFNFPNFRNSFIEKSDSRSASYNDYSIFDENKSGTSDFDFEQLYQQLKEVFESIIDTGKYSLRSKIDPKNAIKELFIDHFFDYWEVSYDNDVLEKMSTGKASFVILMLIMGLSKSNAPILIDQPEDNLDNRSITKDLVTYLRQKKIERQIILVTHNPNVVVNADAENIIIAHQSGQNDRLTSSLFKFDYINGAIENTQSHDINEKDLLKSMGIREHIAEIVEGGKEAFKKRERKYGF